METLTLNTSEEKQKHDIVNQIIALGLNSLVMKPDDLLIEEFSKESFPRIIECWDLLNDSIKFKIFKLRVVDFAEFLKKEVK